MNQKIEVQSSIQRTVRVQQVEGIFDVSPEERSKKSWDVALPIEEREWSIGLICGPSGCGKSTVARHLFGDKLVHGYDWPADKSVLDGFPQGMSIKQITGYLSSVGFSSPPSWLRPFHVLSNGEQFRVTMARVLAESSDIAVVDEFTSVVDRTVAKIGSAAIAKTVRRAGKKLIAVTCHMDVEDWLQPDWVYLPAEGRFLWRSVQLRPPIDLQFHRSSTETWRIFKQHHYMSSAINGAAQCFTVFFEGQPIGFSSWLPFFGRAGVDKRKARIDHRLVVLPDYQGVGIGRDIAEYFASMYAGLGLRVFSGSSHPAVIAARARSPNWRCTKAPRLTPKGTHHLTERTRSATRLRASFEWRGPAMDRDQAEFCYNARG